MGSGRGLGPVRGNWGQGGCEQKKCKNVRGTAVQSVGSGRELGIRSWGGGGGVRVVVDKELKLL